MTVSINTNTLLAVLLSVLLILYAANILFTSQLANALVDKPVRLSFILIPAPSDQCEQCSAPQDVVEVINSVHNIKYKTTEVAYDSTIGEKYIAMYELEKLPALVVTGDIVNEKIRGAWDSFRGRIEEDRVIIDDLMPYYNLADGSVRGVVDLVLLFDGTCETCFDANGYLSMVQGFGMVPGNVTGYDVSSEEGVALVAEYEIDKFPTVLLSPDANDYTGFSEVWDQVGTISEDGWFVLREVQKLSPDYITR